MADISAGLRLRYEFSRQLGAYVGIERVVKLGDTARFARANGEPTSNTRAVAGMRLWL